MWPSHPATTLLTATDIANLARCAQRIYLDTHGDPAMKLPPTTVRQLLWEEGREHEEDVIAALDYATVPHGMPAERIAATRELMRAGAALIYHGYLEAIALAGEPDLLQRVAQPSLLGEHAYIPVEIKNGSAFTTAKKTRAKLPYALQLSAYAELLASEQGWWPNEAIVIDHHNDWQTIDLTPYRGAYTEATRRVVGIREGDEIPGPAWKTECAHCEWQEHCWKELVAADDLTTLANIGEPKREALIQIGIRTVADLAIATPEQLLAVDGVGAVSARTWPMRARAVKSGVPIVLERWSPSAVDLEISYDIENTPEPFVYLHGLLTRRTGGAAWGSPGFTETAFGVFEPVCAAHPEDEASVWHRFLEKLEELTTRGTYAVYIYSSHEKTTLRRLATTHGSSRALEDFIEHFIDLRSEVRRCLVLPTDGESLKTVAKLAKFAWRDDDPGGGQSIAWWAEYWANPAVMAAARDRVLRYNEDDVRASFVVRDWLVEATNASDDPAARAA
ncbi:MAG TPA: TM0106 family RecB-like putative nuclease [Thermoanaerobaculia bacterium]|nr:TM0106 family RecB-like putative nuclease [Thermoanaerobaculia bacterium]